MNVEREMEERYDELRREIDRIAAKQNYIDQMLLEIDGKIASLRVKLQQAKEGKKALYEQLAGLQKAYASLLRLYNELEASRIEYNKELTKVLNMKHHYNIQYIKLNSREGTVDELLVKVLTGMSESKLPNIDIPAEFDVEK